MNELSCVKPIANWDQALAEQICTEVKESVLDAAEVDASTWQEAWSIVMTEGEYGPNGVTEDGMSIAKARSIVEKAVYGATFHNYPWDNPEAPYGEGTCTCPECDSTNVDESTDQDETVWKCSDCGHIFTDDEAMYEYEPNSCLNATTIRREVFSGWFRIYGG